MTLINKRIKVLKIKHLHMQVTFYKNGNITYNFDLKKTKYNHINLLFMKGEMNNQNQNR